MSERLWIRLLELVKEDDEFREAILEMIRAHSAADRELAEWRKRREVRGS